MNQKSKILIYDIDGVIVDSSSRARKYIDQDAENRGDLEALRQSLFRFGETTDGDILILSGIDLVSALSGRYGDEPRPIALTSRCEAARELTTQQLRTAFPWMDINEETLLMRPFGDELLCSVEYKRRVITELMKTNEVVYAIDDHPHICNMYRDLGVTTIHFQQKHHDCTYMSGVGIGGEGIQDDIFGEVFKDKKLMSSLMFNPHSVAMTTVGGVVTKVKGSDNTDALIRLENVLLERGQISDGPVYMVGLMEPVLRSLYRAGITEIRIREPR